MGLGKERKLEVITTDGKPNLHQVKVEKVIKSIEEETLYIRGLGILKVTHHTIPMQKANPTRHDIYSTVIRYITYVDYRVEQEKE